MPNNLSARDEYERVWARYGGCPTPSAKAEAVAAMRRLMRRLGCLPADHDVILRGRDWFVRVP